MATSPTSLDPKLVQEWMRWSSVFELWDLNGDGFIDKDELKHGVQYFLEMNAHNYTMFEVRGILSDMGAADEKGLDRKAFGSFLSTVALEVGVPLEALASSLADQGESSGDTNTQLSSERATERNDKAWNRIPELFMKWDTNKDDLISRHELSVAVRKYRVVVEMQITLADILTMMDASDVNADKHMDIVEFGAFLGRFSLASGSQLNDIVDFFLEESVNVHEDKEEEERKQKLRQKLDQEAMAKGWQEMPLLFDIMDSDNSGTIDRKELTNTMTGLIKDNGLNLSIGDCHGIMSEVDLNRDNQLDRREFGCFLSRFSLAADLSLAEVTYYLKKQKEELEAQRNRSALEIHSLEKGWADMPKLFVLWDKDADGSLSREEIALGINRWRMIHREECKITLAECLQLMDEVDVDGNRTLDQMEFGAFLARFSLATGAKLDELTSFFLEQYRDDDQADERRGLFGRQGSAGGPKGQGFLGSLISKANIGLAEESVETQRSQRDLTR